MDIRSLKDDFVIHLGSQGKSFNTVKNYRNDIGCFLNYLYAKQNSYILKDFTIKSVMAYSAYLDNKYASDNSKRRRVQALRLFFDFLVISKKWPDNPIRKIPVSPKKLDLPNPTEYLSIIRLKNYLEQIKDTSKGLEQLNALRNIIIFYMVYGAGLKVSDISNIKLKHIIEGNEGYRVMVIPNKIDPYTIALPKQFSSYFLEYTEKLESLKKQFKLNFDHLCYNANAYRILSGGISPRGLELTFKNLSDQLKIKITAKTLRQSCILKWIYLDKPASSIKEWMGVKPSYSMKLYNDYFKNNKKDCAFTDI
jgi:site-specific recombinase XerD